MALDYSTLREFPRLRSYEDADRRERETKPIRGDKDHTKPLGSRSQKWRRIKREDDNSIAIYAGMSKPIMRFFPNGDLHISDEVWGNKASSNEIISEVTGLRLFTEQYKAWVRYDGGTAPLRSRPRPYWRNGEWHYGEKQPDPINLFRRNERGNWSYVNPPGLVTHVVNRKGAKTVRARYAAALSYIDALAKLRRDNPPKWGEIAEAFADKMTAEQRQTAWMGRELIPSTRNRSFAHSHAAEIVSLLASEEPGDHYKAYLWLHRDTSPSSVLANVDRVLMMHHHDEWFTEREVPAGTKAHDKYAWAFPKQD